MKVNRIELYHVKLPLSEENRGFFKEKEYILPSWIGGYRQSECQFYLLVVGTDFDGIEGYSAVTAMGTERYGLGNIMAQYFIGLNPLDINLVNQRIQEFSFIGMRNGWIDAAFWDIIGKVKGVPIYKLLGGDGGSTDVYCSTGSTHSHDPEYSREIVRQRIKKEKFKGIKLRVKGTNLQEMSDYVAAARDEAGDDVKIMVDANEGWPVTIIDEGERWTLPFAIQFAKEMEKYNIAWLEEPLNKMNLEGYSELRRSTSTPIAGGEMCPSWREMMELISNHCVDVFQPDAILAGGTFAGGITAVWWAVKEIIKRNKSLKPGEKKIKFSPHTWTTGLGFAIALQLYGFIPEEERGLLEYPLEGNWRPEYWARFIKGGFLRNPSGRIDIPSGPGLGIDIDWKIVNKFGKRIFLGTKLTISITTLVDRGWKQTMYLKGKTEERVKRGQLARFVLPASPFEIERAKSTNYADLRDVFGDQEVGGAGKGSRITLDEILWIAKSYPKFSAPLFFFASYLIYSAGHLIFTNRT